MEQEIWQMIEDQKSYEVSTYGRFRSIPRVIKYKDGRVYSYDSKILSPRIGSNGYFSINFSRYKKGSAHRFVAKAFVLNPDSKPEINHKDGDKLNNHYTNLEWVTTSGDASPSRPKGRARG